MRARRKYRKSRIENTHRFSHEQEAEEISDSRYRKTISRLSFNAMVNVVLEYTC